MLWLSRQSLLRASRGGLSRSRASIRNNHSNSEVRRAPGSPKDDVEDFRPPWVYTLSRFGSVALIPAVALYSIFLYDWGDDEHVFMPPRRWLARMKQSFFTLSPEEERMLNKEVVERRVGRMAGIPPLPGPSNPTES